MAYKVMRDNPNWDGEAYQRAVEKSIYRTWIDKLLGRNKWPSVDAFNKWETEVVKIVDTEDEAKHLVWLGEPWADQSGGRMWYEEICEGDEQVE